MAQWFRRFLWNCQSTSRILSRHGQLPKPSSFSSLKASRLRIYKQKIVMLNSHAKKCVVHTIHFTYDNSTLFPNVCLGEAPPRGKGVARGEGTGGGGKRFPWSLEINYCSQNSNFLISSVPVPKNVSPVFLDFRSLFPLKKNALSHLPQRPWTDLRSVQPIGEITENSEKSIYNKIKILTHNYNFVTCSWGGHLNSLVFLAVTEDGRLACLISL